MVIFDEETGGPSRAVACAREMQRAFRALQPTAAGSVADVFAGGMGVGISTGEVVMGCIGSGRRVDFTAVGSPANLACRLSDLARGGEILADTRTFEALGRVIGAQKILQITVKGYSNLMPVLRLDSLMTDPHGLDCPTK